MRGLVGTLVLVGLLGSSAPAHALAILGTHTSFAPGPDNLLASGGGNIEDVFAAAAHFWELAIFDDRTVTIPFGWTPGSSGLGFFDGTGIFFSVDNDWFVDATPMGNTEYATPERIHASLGGTSINYAAGFTGGIDPADGFDLFSVVLHEIGHFLTFAGPNDPIEDYSDNGFVDVTAPRPLPGLQIPVANFCCHVGSEPVT